MDIISAIGIFCEDIRSEKSGQDIIIGTYPDNLAVPEIPGAIPKVAIYTRINIDPTAVPGDIRMRLDIEGGEVIQLGTIELAYISKSQDDARKKGSPLVGLISRVAFAPFPVRKVGRVKLVIESGAKEILGGILNFERVRSSP